jgi:hypothetical protein
LDNYNYEKLKFIAFLLFFNEEEQEDLIFNDNIKLRKIHDNEHDDFMENYHSEISPTVLTHVLDIKIDKNIVNQSKNWHNNHNFEEIKWNSLDDEKKEFYIKKVLFDYLNSFINSINIVIDIPIEMTTLGKYVNNKLEDFIEFGNKFFASFLHESTINKEDIGMIINIFKKRNNLRLKNNEDYKKNWWLLPFEYFEKYPNSDFLADQVIYLNIILESLLSDKNENTEIGYRLRFRSSLYLNKIAGVDPKFVQKIIKESYNFRSKIVHGSISLNDIENINIKKINEYTIS